MLINPDVELGFSIVGYETDRISLFVVGWNLYTLLDFLSNVFVVLIRHVCNRIYNGGDWNFFLTWILPKFKL